MNESAEIGFFLTTIIGAVIVGSMMYYIVLKPAWRVIEAHLESRGENGGEG